MAGVARPSEPPLLHVHAVATVLSYYFCGVLNAKIQQSRAAGSERSKPPACNNNVLSLSLGVYFELKGERYDNNSVVNILAIGEGSSALLCKTNKQDCCGTLPNRFGEFYYPHGARVSIFITGDGFYRNRGNQMIRLNRRNDVSSPTGRYSCEIPDASGITQKLFINISNEGM